MAAFWDFNAAAFSDGHTRLEVLVESGETVVMEAVFEATHTGPLAAFGTRLEIPPTGKPFVLPHVNMCTVRDGLIVSCRSYWDGTEVLNQLG